MAEDDVHYEIKTVTTVRGTEARSKAKWEKESWELVSQSEQSFAAYEANLPPCETEAAVAGSGGWRACRASMDAVKTVQADGTPRGTLTTAWVVEMNELD